MIAAVGRLGESPPTASALSAGLLGASSSRWWSAATPAPTVSALIVAAAILGGGVGASATITSTIRRGAAVCGRLAPPLAEFAARH